MSNLEVAEIGTPRKVRRGDIYAAKLLSKWRKSDIREANDAAFNLGLLVSASLYPLGQAEHDIREKSEAFPELCYSTIYSAFQNGLTSVTKPGEVRELFDEENKRPANDNNKRARFEVRWFKDIDKIQEKRFVIEDYIAESEFDATVGKPGSGKSAIVTDAMCHVAAGMPWHGRDVAQGLVIYFAAERKLLTERRVAAFKKHHALDDVPFAIIGGRLDLTAGLSDARALIELVGELELQSGHKCQWITFDTLSRTFGGGDQNASKDMGRFVMSVDEIIAKTKAHVSVIHHSPWNETRGKGAIDLDGAIDASFYVSKTGKNFALKCDGANDGEEGIVTKFTLQNVELGEDSKGKTTSAPIVVPTEGNVVGLYDAEPKNRPLKGQAAKALECLAMAIGENGQCPPAGTAGFPSNVSVVTRDQWETAYVKQSTALPDSAKRSFSRLLTQLIEGQHVSNVGIWFWLSDARTNPDKSG